VPTRRDAAHEGKREARASQGGQATHEELVAAYLPLAHQLARRFANRGESLDDLVQVASIGLLKAVERFDDRMGYEFSAFAHQTIVGELKHHFRDQGWAIRVPRGIQELYLEMTATVAELTQELGRSPSVREIATACRRSESDVLEAMEAGVGYRATSLDAPGTRARSVLDRMELLAEDPAAAGLLAELSPHLEALSPRERAIIRLRFVEELTQTQIAERLGLSQMHVSRLLRGALATLRAQYGQEGGVR
jgi:RNA polymerase sigma-B factor